MTSKETYEERNEDAAPQEVRTAPSGEPKTEANTDQQETAASIPAKVSDGEALAHRFAGSGRAHYVFEPGEAKANGKREGRYEHRDGAPGPEAWRAHLEGEQSLLVVPATPQGTCRFGAIDVDIYEDLDLAEEERKARELGLPLMPFRSKSGGAHLYLFLADWEDASRVRVLLRRWAASLGHGNAEVFPKQDRLGDGEAGSGLNMPYFKGNVTDRYAVRDGDFVALEELPGLIDEVATSLEAAEAIELPEAPRDKPFGDEGAARRFRLPEVLPEGQRDDTLFRYGCSLRARGWADDEALRAEVKRANEEHGDPPLDNRQVEKCVRQALKQPVGEAESWEEPTDPFRTLTAPELPSGLLPGVVEDFARAKGRLIGADPGGLAMAALTTCSAVLDDRLMLRVKRHDDWFESARLWTALLGGPSSKKSPALQAAKKPLGPIERELEDEYRRAWRDYKRACKEAEKGEEPEKPPRPRLQVNDTTYEAVALAMGENPQGLLVFVDELAGFFGSMDKYNAGKGGQKDRAFWLQAYDGGFYAVDRVQRGTQFIENLSACVLGGIQPEVMRGIADNTQDDGLVQRLVPIVLRPAGQGCDEPAGPVEEDYAQLVRNLHAMNTALGIHDWADAQHRAFTLSEGAREVRAKAERRHLDLGALEGIAPKLASHFGKWDGLFARLCLLFHCIEHAGEPPREVSPETAERVYRFMHEYLRLHAFAFYSEVLGAAAGDQAVTDLAGHVLAHGLGTVTKRTFTRGSRAMKKVGSDPREAERVLHGLEAHGWLRRRKARRSDSMEYAVNPLVHERYAQRAEREREKREAIRREVEDAVQGAT